VFLLCINITVPLYCEFNYDSYSSNTISNILKMHPNTEKTAKLKKKGFVYTFESSRPAQKIKEELVYIGEIRPISKNHRLMVDGFFKTLADTDFPKLFKHEIKVRDENNSVYWLPIQEPLLPDLEKESKPPQNIIAYYMYLGNLNNDHVFIINEFKAVASFEELESEYSKKIESDPQNPRYYQMRVAFYLQRKKLDKAIKDMKNVIKIDPTGKNYYNYANVYYEKGIESGRKEDYLMALSYANKAMAIDGSLPHGLRGLIYYYLGKYKNALDDLEIELKSVKISVRQSIHYKALAEVCQKRLNVK